MDTDEPTPEDCNAVFLTPNPKAIDAGIPPPLLVTLDNTFSSNFLDSNLTITTHLDSSLAIDDFPTSIHSHQITPFEAFVSVSHPRTQHRHIPESEVASHSPDSPVATCPVLPLTCSHITESDSVILEDVEDLIQIQGIETESNTHHSSVDSSTSPDWLYYPPRLVAYAEKDYHLSKPFDASENYLRGCLWSPDGSCILTNSRDNVLRLFNLPTALLSSQCDLGRITAEEMHSVLVMRENELVYDYVWYPAMCSANPSTCCFASTTRRNPIRLWDAFNGTVRATYRPINHLGEVISAFSIAFSSDGQRLYAGFNRFMHVFDVCRPGSDSVRRPKLGKKPVQGGIISCIAVPRDSLRQIYATGSYNGSVAMFSEPGNLIGMVQACPHGVTQVLFSTRVARETGAPWYLIAGGRMDSRIFLWDARSLTKPLFVLHRRVENHQRFQLDIDPTGRFLFTGNQTGTVCVYDLAQCQTELATSSGLSRPMMTWRAHADCAHGMSVNPSLPLLATASGQRRVCPPAWLHSHKVSSSTGSSDEWTDSDAETASLTDDEAALLPRISPDDGVEACAGHAESHILPFSGQLTRLPRENRLSLWLFPTRQVA